MVKFSPATLFECHFDIETLEETWAQPLPRVFHQVVHVMLRLALNALAAKDACFETLTPFGLESTQLAFVELDSTILDHLHKTSLFLEY